MDAKVSRRRFLTASGKGLLGTGLAGGALTGGSALLSACGSTPPATTSGPVELTYTFPGIKPSAAVTEVQNAINAILKPKINVTLKFNAFAFSDFNQKMNLAFSAGQNVGDIVWTASWLNNYYQRVANGNLLAIDDLLPKYAPGLYASMPKATWEAVKVNGKSYAIINQQLFPALYGINMLQSLAEKYKVDWNTINSYSDFTPVLAAIKAGEPNTIPWFISTQEGGNLYWASNYGWDPVFQIPSSGASQDICVKYNDPNLKVFHVYDTPEYMQCCQLIHSWHQLGYTKKQPGPTGTNSTELFAGKVAAYPNQWRGYQVDARFNVPLVGKSFANPPLLTTAQITGTLMAITSTCQHPQQAMQVLEEFNTNKEVYNLLCFGIEGKDYVFTNKAKGVVGIPPGLTATTDPYNPNVDWAFGNQFNAYYRYEVEADHDLWGVQKQGNQSATPSVALGFSFDTTNVQNQIAAAGAVVSQYRPQLDNGLVDPATTMPTFLSKLKTAGIDQIVAEVQKQISAWASKK